jgi:hypothetical protein
MFTDMFRIQEVGTSQPLVVYSRKGSKNSKGSKNLKGSKGSKGSKSLKGSKGSKGLTIL